MNTTLTHVNRSTGRLGKADSPELSISIIDKIPLGQLLAAEKLLDVGCGYGGFAKAYVNRVEPYIGREEAFNRIWLIDSYAGCVNYCRQRLGFKNAIHANFLTWTTSMKFDVILGNPPYQGNKADTHKMWTRFTKLSLSLLNDGGFMSFVTPDTFIESTSRIGTKVRALLTNGFNLRQVSRDADKYFNVGIKICQWSGVKEPYTGTTDFDGKPVDLRQAVLSPRSKQLERIFAKVDNSEIKKIQWRWSNKHATKETFVETGGHEFQRSGPKVIHTSVADLEGCGILKFVAPRSCSWKKAFATTLPVGTFNGWVPCNEEEVEQYLEFWKSKLVRFLCENYRKTCGFNAAVESSAIPDFRGMTDKEMFTKLNLTNKEIALIEAYCS